MTSAFILPMQSARAGARHCPRTPSRGRASPTATDRAWPNADGRLRLYPWSRGSDHGHGTAAVPRLGLAVASLDLPGDREPPRCAWALGAGGRPGGRRRPGEGADRPPDPGRAGARGHPDGPGRAMASPAHRSGADRRSASRPGPPGPAVLAGDPGPGGGDLAGARLRGALRDAAVAA